MTYNIHIHAAKEKYISGRRVTEKPG